jgi:hypothetical protein
MVEACKALQKFKKVEVASIYNPSKKYLVSTRNTQMMLGHIFFGAYRLEHYGKEVFRFSIQKAR